VKSDITDIIINRAWKAGMEVVGIDGVPEIQRAGNVLRQQTSAKISIRIPPKVDARVAIDAVSRVL